MKHTYLIPITIVSVVMIVVPLWVVTSVIKDRTPEPPTESGRFKVVESQNIAGRLLIIISDKKTGVEYLSLDHGLTRLESTATK